MTGHVLDENGAALPGVPVRLDATQGGVTATVRILEREWAASLPGVKPQGTRAASLAGLPAGVRSTVSGSDGGFVFAGLDTGSYALSATAPNHSSDANALRLLPRSLGATADTVIADLHLHGTGTFTGAVTLELSSDFRNSVVSADGTDDVAITDSTGRYSLTVPTGTWTVRASHAGFLDQTAAGAITAAGQEVQLAPLRLLTSLNLPPIASIAVTWSCPQKPVLLNAAPGSHDPDGEIVFYQWDFDDDGVPDSSGASLSAVTHVFGEGSHAVRLIVTDNRGSTGATRTTFDLGSLDTLFVSAGTGSPSGNGTRASPLSSIRDAVSRASSACPMVLMVSVGTYADGAPLASFFTLRGGLDPGTWLPVPGARSVVPVGASPQVVSSIFNTTVSDFEFVADSADLSTWASIAFRISNCDSTVRFERCSFQSGKGPRGKSGSGGITGYLGYAGNNATDTQGGLGGGRGTPFNHGDRYGGDGATGPLPGQSTPVAGHDSDPLYPGACGPPPASGGAGGAYGTCSSRGSGSAGSAGETGSPGAGGSGPIASGYWDGKWEASVGAPGVFGCEGIGGGGGGAEGACPTASGGSGGGGGQGGGEGGGGGGGQGGGASIAVLLDHASPTFRDCVFQPGGGGDGGDGGTGGKGGPGGAGGRGFDAGEFSSGGDGGPGGFGGGGGGGQGGPGGPSWCLLLVGGSNPYFFSPTFVPGSGGAGGAGGINGVGRPSGADGPPGASGNLGP